MIGFAMCGSFCTHRNAVEELQKLRIDGYDVRPILSETVCQTDTRFGRADSLCRTVSELCGRPIIRTVAEAEPLGPAEPLEALVICPCTGNTLAKMASGITDTSVTMAAKAHLRSDRPLVLALASNDALSANLKNIGTLLCRKNVYFVPMRQDDPERKPHSLVADFTLLSQTLAEAMKGRQLQPIFLP
jgi:dipicolinate synthase subunit B